MFPSLFLGLARQLFSPKPTIADDLPSDQVFAATHQARRVNALYVLNLGWLAIGLVALVTFPFYLNSEEGGIVGSIIVVTLTTYFGVRYLALRGRFRCAALLFSVVIDLAFLWFFLVAASQLGVRKALAEETPILMMMGLAIVFGGALVGRRAAFGFAFVNSVALITLLVIFRPIDDPRFSIHVFWWLLALAIWLYEVNLEGAFARLGDVNRHLEELVAARTADLRQSSQRFRQLTENAQDMVYRIQLLPTPRVEYANPAFLKFTGYAPQELYDNPDLMTDLVHPDDQAVAQQNWVQSAEPQSSVFRFRHKDGTTVWTEHIIVSIYDEDGALVAFEGIARDITERVQMAAAERQQRTLAEALLDTSVALNSTLEFQEVIARILDGVKSVVAYEFASVLLVEGDEARIVAVSGGLSVADFPLQRFSISDNYPRLQEALETGTPIQIPDVSQLQATNPNAEVIRANVKTVVIVPVLVGDKVLGCLVFGHKTPGFYTHISLQYLQLFAHQAGTALRNAQLYGSARSVAILEERQRLARDLHDTVSQNLFAAGGLLKLLPKALQKKPERLPDYLRDLGQLVDGAMSQIRMILFELRPASLAQTDLNVLLEHLCEATTANSRVPVSFSPGGQVVLNEDRHIALYRIAQEALRNAEKHAAAAQVTVRLVQQAGQVELAIEDDGKGFDPQKVPPDHFGVRMMRERAASIGADLQIISAAGQGTQVILKGSVA